jgi:hypothetical protein
MKVGDIVKHSSLGREVIGIVVKFDEDGDPVVLDFKTKVASANWRSKVEVINESR